MAFKLGDRHIYRANKPATYMDANHDKPLWYTYGHEKKYTDGWEKAFGKPCTLPDCTGHMHHEDGTWLCDTCEFMHDDICEDCCHGQG